MYNQRFAFHFFFWYIYISTFHFPIGSARLETLLESPTIVRLNIYFCGGGGVVLRRQSLFNGKTCSRNGDLILKLSIYLMLLSHEVVLWHKQGRLERFWDFENATSIFLAEKMWIVPSSNFIIIHTLLNNGGQLGQFRVFKQYLAPITPVHIPLNKQGGN